MARTLTSDQAILTAANKAGVVESAAVNIHKQLQEMGYTVVKSQESAQPAVQENQMRVQPKKEDTAS